MDWNSIFTYDKGKLYWKEATGGPKGRFSHNAGDLAGGPEGKKGYWRIWYNGKRYKRHRIIWEMFYYPLSEDMVINHKHGVHVGDYVWNLECTSKTFNNSTAKRCNKYSTNKSGKTGVTFSKHNSKWCARIGDGSNRSIFLGNYDTFEEAAFARDFAEDALKIKTAVLLNGPPGSGKDFICNAFRLHHFKASFKSGLWYWSRKLLSEEMYKRLETFYDNRDFKERIPHIEFCGRLYTNREWFKFLSEEYVKPKYGKDWFGRFTLNSIRLDKCNLVLCSDSGFEEEAQVLIDAGFRVIVIHLERQGCTWENDSRKPLTNIDAEHYTVSNNGSVKKTVREIEKRILKSWVYNSEETDNVNRR